MVASQLYLVNFLPHGKTVVVSRGTDLLEAARRAGIDLASVCSGQRDCGQCCVEVLEGQVSLPDDEEEFNLPPGGLQQGHRLACCTRVYGPVKVRVPDAVGYLPASPDFPDDEP